MSNGCSFRDICTVLMFGVFVTFLVSYLSYSLEDPAGESDNVDRDMEYVHLRTDGRTGSVSRGVRGNTFATSNTPGISKGLPGYEEKSQDGDISTNKQQTHRGDGSLSTDSGTKHPTRVIDQKSILEVEHEIKLKMQLRERLLGKWKKPKCPPTVNLPRSETSKECQDDVADESEVRMVKSSVGEGMGEFMKVKSGRFSGLQFGVTDYQFAATSAKHYTRTEWKKSHATMARPMAVSSTTLRPLKPEPEIYTNAKITKLAMEYFNSAKISKVHFPVHPQDADRLKRKRALDSTVRDKPTSEPPSKPGKPRYATYRVSPTSTLPPPCFRRPYTIQQVCELTPEQKDVKGESITLEDVAKLLFSKSTLAALKDWCVAGEWCLNREDIELYERSKSFLHLCSLETCLLDMPDYCLNEERRLVMSTLMLLCRAHEHNVSDTCFTAIGQVAHVTMTDLYRSKFRKEEILCLTASDKDDCIGPCNRFADTLYCMKKTCNLTVIFREYSQWSWFFTMDAPHKLCQLNDSVCPLFADHVMLQDVIVESFIVQIVNPILEMIDQRLALGLILGAAIAMWLPRLVGR